MPRITKSWKGFELRMARRWGSAREGAVGRTGADFLTDWCAVECKLRKSIVSWLLDAVQQAVGAAERHQYEVGGRIFPIVMVKRNSSHHLDDHTLVVMRLCEFEEMLGLERQDGKEVEVDVDGQADEGIS